MNYNEIIKKVEGVCKQWSKRKLTLMGRITIIKSLALAKFIHLLLALPNSPDNLLKNIEKIFYKGRVTVLYYKWPTFTVKKSIVKKSIQSITK